MRVFFSSSSPRKERQKKSDREKEKKKKLREKALSLSPTTRAVPPNAPLCASRARRLHPSRCVLAVLSLRARILLSVILSLSLYYYVYSAALFFRFLKLRNKIRTLSLYSRNSKKRRRRRRVYFLFPSLSLSRFSRALENKRILSLSLSAFPKEERGVVKKTRARKCTQIFI